MSNDIALVVGIVVVVIAAKLALGTWIVRKVKADAARKAELQRDKAAV